MQHTQHIFEYHIDIMLAKTMKAIQMFTKAHLFSHSVSSLEQWTNLSAVKKIMEEI